MSIMIIKINIWPNSRLEMYCIFYVVEEIRITTEKKSQRIFVCYVLKMNTLPISLPDLLRKSDSLVVFCGPHLSVQLIGVNNSYLN